MQGEGAADVVVADALLVTSELVTNAFRHGGGLTRFTVELTDEVLCIAVGDASTRTPVLPDEEGVGEGRIGGYGWLLVRRLATRVSITCHQGGTRAAKTSPPLFRRPEPPGLLGRMCGLPYACRSNACECSPETRVGEREPRLDLAPQRGATAQRQRRTPRGVRSDAR
ncbi:ATP-binding protein [Streptomyces sp. NPDC059893]|uniref:ATP-binding protein n=1 Tax=Streptomyces sp. NPDC059893 TaxID=3346990 RepID=UPI00364855D1